MKQPYAVPMMIILLWCAAIGPAHGQEEIDFLLFLPDSGNQFVNEPEAALQLDTVAAYIQARNPDSGRIFVYGYAADALNDIEPVDLSRQRARHVIAELRARGLAAGLFAEPVGYGSVDLWGENTDETGRSPNRRVRILLDDTVLTPAIVQAAEPEVTPAAEPEIVPVVEPEIVPVVEPEREILAIEYDGSVPETQDSFPWWILLLPLLLIVALLCRLAIRPQRTAGSETRQPPAMPPKAKKPPVVKPPKAPAPADVPAPQPPAIAAAAPAHMKKEQVKVLTEAEIRLAAYGLYEQRGGTTGYDTGDWYNAIQELSAYYRGRGYRVILYWEDEA